MNREIALTLALQIAGVGLLLICVANFIAPKKLRWTVNLEKTEVFFQQVFKVHTFYIVLTMLGREWGEAKAPVVEYPFPSCFCLPGYRFHPHCNFI